MNLPNKCTRALCPTQLYNDFVESQDFIVSYTYTSLCYPLLHCILEQWLFTQMTLPTQSSLFYFDPIPSVVLLYSTRGVDLSRYSVHSALLPRLRILNPSPPYHHLHLPTQWPSVPASSKYPPSTPPSKSSASSSASPSSSSASSTPSTP